MKTTLRFFAAAAVIVLAGCNKTPQVIDFDIVGDFSLTAEKGASNGWIPGDKVGVYVTSDGVTQANLPYTPSQVAEDNSMDLGGGVIFHMYGEAVGNVTLNADDKAAGYKKGKHVIYAYCPYSGDSESINAVAIPDITVQDASYQGMTANQGLCFCCTKKEIEGEYSSAPVDLGTLAPIYNELNTGSFGFEAESGLDGLNIVDIEISAAVAIAQSGTYDIEKGKFNGEGSKTIKFSNVNMPISYSAWAGYGTDPLIFFVSLTKEEVEATDFNFTVKLSNGNTLTATAKAGDPSGLGILSFGGAIVLK